MKLDETRDDRAGSAEKRFNIQSISALGQINL